ncbi:upper zone of growth plate and cartilage matrix-associated protein [Pogona vitticeps]|uniref:Unique cartilage matrix-associated protein n=1 Tax=Pogona vitticeps TaxID=103695 RepID=A0A6J0TYH3_9SAUR|nr:unique cartilage matrix-associated protein [Pogona vitticeps]
MDWKQVLVVSCLVTLVLLIVLEGGNATAVGPTKAAAGESSKESMKKRVFMQESDASNFFKKRGKRATKSRDELNAETRQMLAADEQRREYFEEQRNEFENFVEEERDEQDERSREQVEQWREYHYDGLYPPYEYNRHVV